MSIPAQLCVGSINAKQYERFKLEMLIIRIDGNINERF